MAKEPSRAVRVLGLACSPRRGGNTDLMLDSALEGAAAGGAESEKLYVHDMDISPCRACDACFRTGECVQQDEMQDLYPKLLTCDAIAIAAPIFSMGIAAQAKTMIDRLQCLWAKKYILHEHTVPGGTREGRRGLWLSAAGLDRPTVFDPAKPTVKVFFDLLEIRAWESVLYHGVDERGAILEVEGALEDCRRAGEALLANR